MNLSNKSWADFPLSDIFSFIQRGKRLKNEDHVPGVIPYVSSTSMNNGVDDFVTPDDKCRVFSNCISLANSGSVGCAFYEPFSFVASDHVTCLKSDGFSPYVYLFLATVIRKQAGNFNFNREIKDIRLKKIHIMLPVDSNGNPDFEFMNDYMKFLLESKYKHYLDYLQPR